MITLYIIHPVTFSHSFRPSSSSKENICLENPATRRVVLRLLNLNDLSLVLVSDDWPVLIILVPSLLTK